jgi:hypothetical protein
VFIAHLMPLLKPTLRKGNKLNKEARMNVETVGLQSEKQAPHNPVAPFKLSSRTPSSIQASVFKGVTADKLWFGSLPVAVFVMVSLLVYFLSCEILSIICRVKMM